jgi:hypothetical protein
VIANLVAPGTSILVPGTGHFSDGWAEQVEAFGGVALRTPYVEGLPIDPAASRRAARRHRPPHRGGLRGAHRHRRGTTSDLAALRRAIDAAGHPALFVVDVVASLGAAPFAMDALGVNVAMGASQKGLMLQPGMAFVAVDERAMAVADATPAHRFYWDWQRRRSEHSYRKFLRHAAALSSGRPRSRVRPDRRRGLSTACMRAMRASPARCTPRSAAGPRPAPSACSRRRRRPARFSVTAVEVVQGIDPRRCGRSPASVSRSRSPADSDRCMAACSGSATSAT